jgi:hypothetical protein
MPNTSDHRTCVSHSTVCDFARQALLMVRPQPRIDRLWWVLCEARRSGPLMDAHVFRTYAMYVSMNLCVCVYVYGAASGAGVRACRSAARVKLRAGEHTMSRVHVLDNVLAGLPLLPSAVLLVLISLSVRCDVLWKGIALCMCAFVCTAVAVPVCAQYTLRYV